MSDKYVVEIKGVSKSFNDQMILKCIDLKIHDGEFLTLLGPSGCGKTTLLRMISGFEEPTQGDIFINGKNAKGLPPHERHVHTVFQSYALFPHMTVFENIAFGLRCNHVPESEIPPRVEEALRMVKLESLSQRKPTQLSGGQQQRVAIARAVVNRPLVLLLDEPLSSLDYRLRKTMQMELRQLQRKLGITFIFVTHDQEEALSMSDRVVVMSEGIITQIGTPRQVYEEPACLSVAKFIGEVNIFEPLVSDVIDSKMTVNIEGMPHTYTNKHGFKSGDQALVLVRPEDIRVYDSNEVKDPEHMYHGIVEDITYKGTTVDLMVRLSTGKLLAITEFFDEDDDSLVYTLGEKVWLHWVNGWEVILPYEN